MRPSRSAARALDEAHREEWGRLLSLLVAQYRRIDLAEDALGDAFEAASIRWPDDGVPGSPAAWLLTAARRRVIDRLRRESVAAEKFPLLVVDSALHKDRIQVRACGADEVSDERLRLVLLCAHPALAPEAAAALTLRLVLGVATEDIARLFLVPTTTMAARLTRARKRLAGQVFDVPDGARLAERVDTVAGVAYLAFTAAYAPGSDADVVRADQAAEAIRLTRVLREVVPTGHGDLDALLALMLLQHSRRDARVDHQGRLVLLPDQDRGLWHHDEVDEAIALLSPLVHAPASTYLLQALIAVEHAIAPHAAATDWSRIGERYAELEALDPSPVVRLHHAVARAESDGAAAGLSMLEGLELPGHRLPATRAELWARLGRHDEARAAYLEAVARCADSAERAHLLGRLAELTTAPETEAQPPATAGMIET